MTVYDTVGIRTLLRWTARAFLALTGWRTEGHPPRLDKYVAIAAPHTSNWDFVYTLCLALVYRLRPRIMMKDAWFRWPLGPVFRWLGALPVDRSRSNNMVARCIEAFAERPSLVLVVPPSGTRRRVVRWKTGFYHIAHGARVPIALGFLDYRRKVGGFGPTFETTGDLEGDLRRIRAFYRGVTGRHPWPESAEPLAAPALLAPPAAPDPSSQS
jgi:1-acyl-sn-glycerol-3-phosphate acyltransferase